MRKQPKRSKPDRARPSPIPTADRALRAELAQAHALEALSYMRARGWSLARAARQVGEPYRTVLRHIRPALRKDARSRYIPRPEDRLVRRIEVMTTEGKVVLPIGRSRDASMVGAHWNAIKDRLEGRPSALRRFRTHTIRVGRKAYRLLTDPRVLERRAAEGEVAFESIYALLR